jgi:glycosyltransferase involved in cell wall biosynthesis
MPFRNAAGTLPECLESILRQTLRRFELLAIDDGSEDDSQAMVERLAQADPRVRLLQPGSVGLVGALNLGVERSRAPLVARMDADDVMHEERLQAQRDFLRQNGSIALVASQVALIPPHLVRGGYREYVRWQNRCVESEEIRDNLYVESPLAHPSVMVRRSVLVDAGGYRHGDFPEDYELWLRMNRAGYEMAKIPRILLFWRDHETRLSRVDPRYAREAFDRLRAEYLAQDPRVLQGRDLVVWGAGRRTRLRARLLMDRGIRPQAWIDVNPRKTGKEVWNLPVHPPSWLERNPRPLVLIYVRTRGAREQIASFLAERGYRPGQDFISVG